MRSGTPPRAVGLPRRRSAVVVCVAALIALSGCTALGSPGLPDGEVAADRFTSLDGYAGTAEVTYAGATSAANRTVEIAVRPRTVESRIEVREPAHSAGNVLVYNRTHIVRYNATRGSVTRTALDGSNRTRLVRDRLSRLVDRAGAGETGKPVGVSSLPVVPADGGGNETRMEYSYAGTEMVLGRQAHVVQMRPVDGADGGIVNQTLWIDAEWFVTLRAHSVRRVGGERVTYRFRFTDITFDPQLSDRAFTFDPPPGAAVNETSSRERSTYDSRAELAAAAEMAVPDPAVPEGFALVRARHTVGEGIRRLTLSYRRGTSRLSVEKADPDGGPDLPGGETVAVGNRTGRYVDFGVGARVVWVCDGYRYTVGGTVEKGELVGVAETIACE